MKVTGISTPFVGVQWEYDKIDKKIQILQAKAFEVGRLFTGTYVELMIDNSYDYRQYLERITYYLEDIGITNTKFNLFDEAELDKAYKENYTIIENQFIGKYSELAPYFDAGSHIFTTLQSNNLKEFNQLIINLNIPQKLKNEKENTLIWFLDLREYFEGIIFHSNNNK